LLNNGLAKDIVNIFYQWHQDDPELGKFIQDYYIFGSLADDNFHKKNSDLDVLALIADGFNTPWARTEITNAIRKNKPALEKTLACLLHRTHDDEIVHLTAITRFEFDEDIGFPKTTVAYNGKAALSVLTRSMKTLTNAPLISSLRFDMTSILDIKCVIGSIQQFRTDYVSGTAKGTRKVMKWSPETEKENVVIKKETARLAAILYYTLNNANNPEKTRKAQYEKTSHEYGTQHLLGLLMKTIDQLDKHSIFYNTTHELLEKLRLKIIRRSYTSERAANYFLSEWEQSILYEIIWQKAVDWLGIYIPQHPKEKELSRADEQQHAEYQFKKNSSGEIIDVSQIGKPALLVLYEQKEPGSGAGRVFGELALLKKSFNYSSEFYVTGRPAVMLTIQLVQSMDAIAIVNVNEYGMNADMILGRLREWGCRLPVIITDDSVSDLQHNRFHEIYSNIFMISCPARLYDIHRAMDAIFPV